MTKNAPVPTSFGSAVVFEDHPLVAEGISNYLKSNCNFSEAFIFGASEDFWVISSDERKNISLAVIDFWLNLKGSTSLIAQLAEQDPYMRLLVISADESVATIEKAKNSGAHGFIGKHASPEKFHDVVHTLMRYESCFPSEDGAKKTLQNEMIHAYGLSARQVDVLSLAMRGWPNKRIAQSLGISEQTVKDHMSIVLSKLGVGNRVEAMALLVGRQSESERYE